MKKVMAMIINVAMIISICAVHVMADSYEPNDSIAKAYDLTYTLCSSSDEIYPDLYSNSDVDWYKVTMYSTTQVTFCIDHGSTTAGPAIYIDVYDSLNASTPCATSIQQGQFTKTSPINAKQGQTYYIKIYGNAQGYMFFMTRADEDPYEYNDNIYTAFDVTNVLPTVNEEIYPDLSNINDVDWYKFTMSQSKTIQFCIDHISANREAPLRIDVYDSLNATTPCATSIRQGQFTKTNPIQGVTGKTYYAKVSAYAQVLPYQTYFFYIDQY